MYVFAAVFFIYVYCLDNFLGDWIKAGYKWLADVTAWMGMVQLSYTIDSLGYQALHGSGLFITAGVFTFLTSCLIGAENLISMGQGD